MEQVLNYGRGYVYLLQYHVVWCVKYRHKILSEKIERKLIEILYNIAENHSFKILEVNTDLDHVHLLIECTPQHYIPDMIKALKGLSARYLFKHCKNELSEVSHGGHIWNPSYFITSVNENSKENIIEYIRSQKIKK